MAQPLPIQPQRPEQQQQFYSSSPNHNEFHGGGYHYLESAGSSNLGLQMNGLHHSHGHSPLDLEDDIPHIYEQTPETEGGYSDLTLLSDPASTLFASLGIHSPTQPQTADYAPYLPQSSTVDTSPIFPPVPPNTSASDSIAVNGHRTSPTPLNLTNLPPYLSPAHSPNLSPNLGASPSSEHTPSENWESSSNVSFDGTSSPPDGIGAPLRRSVSASGSGYGEGKSYRRNIEKKSRDKKTLAYMKLKKELEDISKKNYGQRCQAEVLDGAANLLAQKAEENRRLILENQAFRDKLKQYGLWTSD